MHPKRLTILGVGLLGGSIGLAVRERIKDCRIVGYGPRPAALQQAQELGALDEAYESPARAVREADLVILCAPVGSLGEMLEQVADSLRSGAIVTDVGSTKRTLVETAGRTLPSHARFVGSHPMAGSEKRGVRFARADLFQGAVCITTPTAQTDSAALQSVEEFWKTLGMRTTRLSPEEHDRLLADVSHLPHAVAAALVAIQEGRALNLSGKGFQDLTRIAAGDPGLWRDILIDNRENVRAGIDRLTGELQRLSHLLQQGNAQEVQAWLDAAARIRQGLEN